MKTLSQLIQEAEERFGKTITNYCQDDAFNLIPAVRAKYGAVAINDFLEHIQDFLKTELTNIVKESFMNTRVEEKEYAKNAQEEYTFGSNQKTIGYNQALGDLKNKQQQFLVEK